MRSGIDFELQLARIVAMTPTLLVMFVGVILAIRRMPMQARSCWALLGSLMLSAFNMLGLPVFLQTVISLIGGFQTTQELWLRTIIFTLPHSLVAAISWGLILFAVFDRPVLPKFLDEDESSA